MRSTTLCLASALLVTGAAGCAFEAGEPWGVASFAVETQFDDADRTDEDGRIRTALDYRVVIDSIDLELASVSLDMASGDEQVSFDPAAPPAGFSLCHNGHCHAADGRLVAYEDVVVEASGGGASVTQGIGTTIRVSSETAQVPLAPCPNGCQLPRGALNAVRVDFEGMEISGTAFDARSPSRLPEEGLPFVLHADAASLNTPASGAVGDDTPLYVDIQVSISPTGRAFDAIDFEEIDTLSEPLSLQNNLDLDATIHRR